jgi:hypothetical protein
MAKSPGTRTRIFDNSSGATLEGSGAIRTYPATVLEEADRLGDDAEVNSLRATYRDVIKSLRLRPGTSQLAIKTIEVHERLTKKDGTVPGGQEAEQPPGVAVSYSNGGPLLFSQNGIRNPLARYFGIAHSLECLPLASDGPAARSPDEWLNLQGAWMLERFGRVERCYSRLRCAFRVYEGFLRSDSCAALTPVERRRPRRRANDLEQTCASRGQGQSRCCDCFL